jgi:hypothetical protein
MTRRSQDHYGILTFTTIFVPDQLQLNTCPLVGRHLFKGAPATYDLRSDLPILQLGGSFAIERECSLLQNNRRRYGLLCYW